MNRSEYLKKLESKLSILDEKEITKIIEEYDNLFAKKIKDGHTEAEVIEELGDVNALVKKILKKHKISSKYLNKENNNFEEIVSRFINYIVDGTRDFISKIEKKDYKAVTEIIIYVLISLIALWILKLPFYIIEVIGRGIFNIFSNPIGNSFAFLWSFIVNVCYALLVIWIIVIIINRFKTNKKETTEEPKKEKVDTIQKKTESEDIKAIKCFPIDILMILLKILIVIMILPLFFMQIGLFVAVAIIIALAIKGIVLIGPLLVLVGLIFILGVALDLIFYLSFGKGGKKQ